MSSRSVDISGKRFGCLTAIMKLNKKNTGGGYLWLFQCDCGSQHELSTGNLISRGGPNRCVNCPTETLRQLSPGIKKRTYSIYCKMISRVHIRSREYQHLYADVSITDRWVGPKGYENFLEDMGECPSEKHSINRIACSNIYSKDTCEWATARTQLVERKLLKSNKSGVTGVKWRDDRCAWESRIKKERPIIVYYGHSFLEAVTERVEAEIMEYGFSKTVDEWIIHGVDNRVYENGLTKNNVIIIALQAHLRGGLKTNAESFETFLRLVRGE
jgi:hypothetical protein